MPEDRRGKWKRRKRGRRPKQEEEDMEEEEEENNNNDGTDDVDNADELHQNGSSIPNSGIGFAELVEDSGSRICDFPSVVKRIVIRPHSSITAVVAAERAGFIGESSKGQDLVPALENISFGQLQALSTVPADSLSYDLDGPSSAYVISPPSIMEGKGVVKRFGDVVHILPMHSDWFAPNTIDRLERQVVPQFFSGKSPNHTPKSYMEFRNAIVSKYMENPEKTLTISDCQGLVDGIGIEVFARVFRFLDHWGIINYCATTESQPGTSRDVSDVWEDTNGEVHVPSAALKSIDSLIKFNKPNCRHKGVEVYSSLSSLDGDPDLDIRLREHLCDNHCNHCSRPLTTVYFQSQKKADILLCSDCFHHGRYIIGHSCLDFLKVDPTKNYDDQDGDNWTDQETLLLLEALELYGENWVQIADHVGSKTRAQCIIHFLRSPVEDGLLDKVEVPGVTNSENPRNQYDHHKGTDSNGDLPGCSDQYSDTEIKLPFVKSPNPVMALVAFLASAVGPRVAASCAHASLMVLSEDDRMKSEGVHGKEAGENQRQDNGAEPPTPLPQDKIMVAFRAGLSAAATKAKLFADHEEREIQRLTANIVNHQLKRMELKLKQFAEIETLLMKECEQVEKTRQRFAAEQARMRSTRFGTPEGISPQTNNNNLQGMSLCTGSGNNQVSAPSQQSMIPGFSNNPQQVQAQMQFMARQQQQQQQQQAFSFGPRLPLNVIQTNAGSTPSPNVMFGNNPAAVSINQPSFSHTMVRSSTGSGSSSGLGLN